MRNRSIAKKAFDKFWKKVKDDNCDRETLASISFDEGHALRHEEYDKAVWWYNLSLTKKKQLFDKRFFDDKFDINRIHKETITILYTIHIAKTKDEK